MILELKQKIIEELLGFKGRVGLSIEIDNESFHYNNKEVFPSASVIKIPILIEAFRQHEEGKINLEELSVVKNRAGGSGVIKALSSSVSMTIGDLMTLMITVSDNTATNMLIDLLGMDSINHMMKNIGLQNTVLGRKMMDFAAAERGCNNFTSPNDILICLKIINEGGYLEERSQKHALEIMNSQQFLDKLPARMDLDKIFVASKTGSLNKVEHDCAILKYAGKNAYVVVLTDRFDEAFAARQLISRIGKHIYDYLTDIF